MEYQEIIDALEENFPIILEAYKISWNKERTPETDEAYAIGDLSNGLMFTEDLEGIDWEICRQIISKEKIDKVKKYYSTFFEARKKFESFTATQQKRLEALLGKQGEEIDVFI
jgi:hypothetical protein